MLWKRCFLDKVFIPVSVLYKCKYKTNVSTIGMTSPTYEKTSLNFSYDEQPGNSSLNTASQAGISFNL